VQRRDGNFELSHMDEFIDGLLREERVNDIQLPRSVLLYSTFFLLFFPQRGIHVLIFSTRYGTYGNVTVLS
jgi:hypothetical protein